MTDHIPEPLDSQMQRARSARDPLGRASFGSAAVGVVLVDLIAVGMGWLDGSPGRSAVALLGIDVAVLVSWVVIGIPLRRWLGRSPY